MKKLFTLAAAVLASMAMIAQTTVFKWSPTESECVGSVFLGTTDFTVSTVKIHSNNDEITALKMNAGYKFADKKFISIKPAEGSFKAGDIVSLSVCYNNTKEKSAIVDIYTPDGQNKLYSTPEGVNGRLEAADPAVVTYTLEADADSIILGRGGNTATFIPELYVTRPEQKTIVSQVEAFYNAKVNGENLTLDQIDDLENSHSVTLSDSYTTAPVVTFTKRTTIIYDDESENITDEDINVTAELIGETWEASATIGDILYTVRAPKAASYTVTYMHGEKVLGTEVVAAGGHPVEYTQYETLPLADFGGWFRDAELENQVELNLETIADDATYYAKFTKIYLSNSVNIEQLVLDYGVNYDIEAEFIAADIEFANLNALDSLNDEKDLRNEPYLGLKLKKQGAYVACWIKEGDKIAVKFGAIKDAVKIGVNGEYNELPASDVSSFIERVADKDAYLEIITKSDKTVVLKQIMLNEGIAEVILPGSPSGIEEIEAGAKAVKKVENGQLVIIKNGVKYNALGTEIK